LKNRLQYSVAVPRQSDNLDNAAFRVEMLRNGNARWACAAAMPPVAISTQHYSTITAVPPPHEFLQKPRNYQLSVAAHIFLLPRCGISFF
jgi:hypothetical protein